LISSFFKFTSICNSCSTMQGWGFTQKGRGHLSLWHLLEEEEVHGFFFVLLQCYKCLFIQVDDLNITTNLAYYWFYGMLIACKKLNCDAKNERPYFGTTWRTSITNATSKDNSGVATSLVNKTSLLLFWIVAKSCEI